MAEQFLYFVWDETKDGWVPFSQSAISLAGNKVFPKRIIDIPNAKRVSQFGLEALQIPVTEWKKEGGKSSFEPITPISPNQEPETKLKLQDVIGLVPSAASAYEKWRTSETPLQVGTPGEPGLITSQGIKTKGVAKNVTEFVKNIFSTNAIPVEINAPLPGEPNYVAPGGLATTGRTQPTVATTKPSPMADLLGGAPAGQGKFGPQRGVPMRPTVGASISYQSILQNIDEDNAGIFTYNNVDSILLPQRGGQLSTPVDLNRFKNVTLFNLPPEEVIKYQKKFKFKETGRMDSALATKITDLATQASRENILRLNPEVQDKTQISWEDAVLGDVLSSAAGGGGVKGPTPEQIKAYTRSIKIKANEIGVDLDDATLKNIVNSFARGEIASENLDEVIVRRGTIDFGQPLKGKVAEQMAALKQSAAAYGINYNDDWYRTSVLNILKGKSDVETYNQQIKDLAKSQYPTLAAQIDAGYTVQAIASPYISTMSQILELNPGEITLYDDTIRRALTGINEQNQPALKPLWQFEQDLRKDERWRYTKNAEQDLMGTGIKLLRNFGLV
jgi:hypothetical protein